MCRVADLGTSPAAGDIVPRLLAAPTSRAVEATEAAAGDQAAPSQPQTSAQQKAGQPKARAAHLSGEDLGEPQLAGHAITVNPEELAPRSRLQQLWKGLSRPWDKSTAALPLDTETAASTAQIESSLSDPVSDELGSALVQATKAGNQDAAKSGILGMEASMDAQKQVSVQGWAGKAWSASLWGAAGKLLPWRASWPRSAMPCTHRGLYGCIAQAFHTGLHSRVLHDGASCCEQCLRPGHAKHRDAQKGQALAMPWVKVAAVCCCCSLLKSCILMLSQVQDRQNCIWGRHHRVCHVCGIGMSGRLCAQVSPGQASNVVPMESWMHSCWCTGEEAAALLSASAPC